MWAFTEIGMIGGVNVGKFDSSVLDIPSGVSHCWNCSEEAGNVYWGVGKEVITVFR